jgi:hypothetical protein
LCTNTGVYTSNNRDKSDSLVITNNNGSCVDLGNSFGWLRIAELTLN